MSSKRYHTFLSHNSEDKPAVEQLAYQLRQEGIEPWLDKWNLIPGRPWQPAIEEALNACDTCTVFIGPSGIGSWQNEEMRAAINRRVRQTNGRFRVIPVLLPGTQRPERSSLPTFLVATTWVEFRKSLDDADAFHRLISGIRGIEPGPGPGKATHESICPYRGLQMFDVEHARFFFGREALTEWLLDELRLVPNSSEENRFLAIIGASGSGKSSLARAGLLSALNRGGLDSSQEWPIVICRPGQDPVESLAVALVAHSHIRERVSSVRNLMFDLCNDERTLHLITRSALHNAPEMSRAVVLVDQFEEIFTLCYDDSLRRALIDNLLYASSVTRGKTVVILTMRADFYGKCAGYHSLAATLSDHQVLVGPLTEKELYRAIERPAQLISCEFETGLIEMLIQDVKNQTGALPLLQHALSALWERREGRLLTCTAYEDIGRLAGTLERRANDVFDGFNEDERKICRQIFLRLTQPGEGTEDTKRRASFQELLPVDGDSTTVHHVIQALADTRLITTEGDKNQHENRFVEVAHEALIRGWSKLRGWIDSEREALRVHRRLADAATEWQRNGHDQSYLYRGVRLAEAEEWSHTYVDVLNPLEHEFLLASSDLRNKERAAEEMRQRKLRRRALLAISAGTAAMLLALFAFALLFNAQSERERAQRAARKARVQRLAAQANTISVRYPQRSLLLAVEALKANLKEELHVADAEQALRDALAVSSGYALSGHEDVIEAVAISSDNRWLATGSRDKTARLWDLTAPDPAKTAIVLRGHDHWILAVTISPDSHWLVTGSHDSTARLWDLTATDPAKSPIVLRGHEREIIAVAISPDNHWLATGSKDKTARLWDLTAPDPAKTAIVLRGHKHVIEAVAFSPDNHWLVTAGIDKTARLWDLTAPDPAKSSVVLHGHEGYIFDVAISSDNHWLVTGSGEYRGQDHTARLWDLTAPDPARIAIVLSGHTDYIEDVAISSDNHWLATGSRDKTARLWDLTAPDPAKTAIVLRGHDHWILAVTISPDSHWLVTGSHDSTARLWDLTATDPAKSPIVLRGHEGFISDVAISPDNHWLVIASEDWKGQDHAARLWNLDTEDPSETSVLLRGHKYSVEAVAISPDNHWLATGSRDSTARLWDLTAPDPAKTAIVLRGHRSVIADIAISHDNHWLATGSRDSTARLWDLTAPDPAKSAVVLRGHEDAVVAVAFSPDNHWLATGSIDKTVRLWDLTIEDPSDTSIVLDGYEDWIEFIAISPDNHWLVAAGMAGRTARLWDLTAPDPSKNALVLHGHEGAVKTVAFSPDNHWLATGSNDRTVRLWDMTAPDPSKNALVLHGHKGAVEAAIISADNHWLATGSKDETARLWDLTAPDPAKTSIVMRGHESTIESVAISPDNHWLVTIGTYDNTVRLWDLTAPDPAQTAIVWRGHEGYLNDVAISSDSHWLVAASKMTRLWTLGPDKLFDQARIVAGRNLSTKEWEEYFPGESYRKTFPEFPEGR